MKEQTVREENATVNEGLKRRISLIDAVLLGAGGMIGSGIFIVSADMSRYMGSAGWLLAVWAIGGFMTISAALSYGELSAMYPRAGGQYVYLKEAYSPLTAFIYGWSLFAVIQTGTIAAVGVSFSKFLAYLVPQMSEDIALLTIGSFMVSPAQLLAIFIIAFLTFVNQQGVNGGTIIQTIFTSTKILSIAFLIVAGFMFSKSDIWQLNWSEPWHLHGIGKDGSSREYFGVLEIGAAMASALVGAIMSFEAWNNATFVAGEIINPKKNLGLSLFFATLLVTVVYLLLNLMFTSVLSMHDIAYAERDRVGIDASVAIFGNEGTVIISVLIMIATFGCNNGLILAGSRVYYSMAKDGLFFKKAANLNKHSVPGYALWIQCAAASILCLSGKYGDLLDMITFTAVMFYVLTILGVFILRVKKPELERPYKAFGYPIVPAVYIVLGLSFCILLIIYKPQFTWPGLIIALLGIPIYYINKGHRKN